MMSAERLLVLKGPAFKEKLWCACELLMWVESGGSTSSIDLLPIAGCTLSAEDDDWEDPFSSPSASTSPQSAFQFAMLEVVRACGSAAKFNHRACPVFFAPCRTGLTNLQGRIPPLSTQQFIHDPVGCLASFC